MRVPDSDPVGRIGLEETKADFARLKWGANENLHDVGTDLVIAVRDARGFDLGILVGAQVKSGPSWFSEPTSSPDPEGWWFRSDQAHVDYWLGYNDAHLIILHDNDARISYYEHITPDTVVSTGEGSKILVPTDNRIDEAHRDALLKIAGTGRPEVPLEGTAWTGATPPVQADRLRFGLIVPRLVAPHPNLGVAEPLTPEVSLALMMQARFQEIARADENLEARGSSSASDGWRWRLVRALETRVLEDDSSRLRACCADPPDSAGRVAATVMFASAELESGRPQEARAELEQTLGRDDASPVDHAWLCLQHSRALVELGEIADAREQASRAYSIRDVARHDVTATAISGVAATILFNTADWEARDLGAVVQDSDTAVTWWRAETALRGATAVVEREFKDWCRDSSVTLGGTDQANNQLYAAALSASHLGAHGTWAHFSSLLGRDSLLRLDRFAPKERAAAGLTSLRLGGDEKALSQAGRRLLEDGPSSALRAAASAVRMEYATSSTVFADLALLKTAGDVLDQETARAATDWLVAALESPPDLLASTRTGRVFAVEPTLVEHLTATVGQMPEYAVQLATRFVPAVPDIDNPLVDQVWARFLAQIPPEAWTNESCAALEPTERTTAGRLRTAIREIRARFHPAVRESVLEELRGGSLLALEALGDVTKIPSEFMGEITSRLVTSLAAQREEAAKHQTSFGGSDLGSALAIILSFHPDSDAFESLLEYLGDRNVARSLKRGALRAFISNSEHLSLAWRAAIPAAIDGIDVPSGAAETPFEGQDISAEVSFLAILFGNLGPEDAASHMARLLAGDVGQRAWACRLAASEQHESLTPTLAILVSDQSPAVRASAAAALVSLAETNRSDPLTDWALAHAGDDPGILVPAAIAAEAARWPECGGTVRELLNRLGNHESAMVRMRTSRALDARRQ